MEGYSVGMNGTRKLFEKNNRPDLINLHQIKYRHRMVTITIPGKDGRFSDRELSILLSELNYCFTHYPFSVGIVIDLGEVQFSDKLVYVLLECVIDYVLRERGQIIAWKFTVDPYIMSEGIRYSPLHFSDRNRFQKAFDFSMQEKHYRRVLSGDIPPESSKLSDLMFDVVHFLQNNNVPQDTCMDLGEVVVELAGNAIEHCKADTLVDLDITDGYVHVENRHHCYGLNVCVLNFSDINFPDLLRNRMTSQQQFPERYEEVKAAYHYHRKFFDDTYDEDDFFTISSFQHRVSGSPEKKEAGGVGLTRLIRSIEDRAEDHTCYIFSANNILFFKPLYMKLNDDDFTGFNSEGRYLDGIPDKTNFEKLITYFPGTGFNLNFVINEDGDGHGE